VPDARSTVISVVCPAYAAAAFIEPTLESACCQTRPPDQIVVCDDGSKDGTAAVVRRVLNRHPHIDSQLIDGVHAGPGSARNRAVARAVGEWIAFLDADDLWDRRKIEAVIDVIRRHASVNMICHAEECVRSDGSRALMDYGSWFEPNEQVGNQLYERNLFSTSATVCRRDLLERAGLFDETLSSWQDYDLWLRMAPLMRPYFIRDVLGSYPIRMGSISTGPRWPRWKNTMTVLWRYRHYGGAFGFWRRAWAETMVLP